MPVTVSLFLSDNNSRDSADILLGHADQAARAQDGQVQDAVVQVQLSRPTPATAQYFLIAEADTDNAADRVQRRQQRRRSRRNSRHACSSRSSICVPTVGRPDGLADARAASATATVNVINGGNVAINRNVTIRAGRFDRRRCRSERHRCSSTFTRS